MTQPPSPSAAAPPLSITLAIEAARAEWAKEGSNLSSAVRAALAVYRDTEIDRLNKWADGFSDAQLKERRLCEERIKEIEAERDRLAAERAKPAVSDHEAALALAERLMKRLGRPSNILSEWLEIELADALAERGRVERERCAQVADAYAEENITMAGDTVLHDPFLSGRDRSPEGLAKSEELMIKGCVHSSMYHASKNIAAAVRNLTDQTTNDEA